MQAFPVTVNSVDVAVTKTVSDAAPKVGDTVDYTITATNLAVNSPATNVQVTDVLPDGVTPGIATVPDGTTLDGSVWTIPSLAVGDSETLTIPVTINAGTAGTTIDNTAFLSAVFPPDTNGENDSATASLTVINQPPVADFTSVVNVLDVEFMDASSDPDGTIAFWSWNFGDPDSGEENTSIDRGPEPYVFGVWDVHGHLDRHRQSGRNRLDQNSPSRSGSRKPSSAAMIRSLPTMWQRLVRRLRRPRSPVATTMSTARRRHSGRM